VTRRARTHAVVAVGLLLGAQTIVDAAVATQTWRPPADSVAARRASTDTALAALTRSVAAQLRCPVCQGLSLADSPSELALEMKDVVREQLAAGRTPDEVKAYFVAKYGEWILLEPPRRGVNLLAYALPAIALIGGLGVIWVALRRWTSVATPDDEVRLSDPLD
jgi:cytochrome c-type biogenesis protein CcmH/NrfF